MDGFWGSKVWVRFFSISSKLASELAGIIINSIHLSRLLSSEAFLVIVAGAQH